MKNNEQEVFRDNHSLGVRKQLKHFNSEVFELNEAILDYENAKYYMKSSREELAIAREHIAEEIGDCMLMLMQFQEYYNISNNDILDVIDFKLKRTLKKVDEEKNGNTRNNKRNT